MRRWVGIDEAGYGPNLGPLVMTAVVAEGPGGRRPDVWGDLPETVDRAGGRPDRLWVDDSKRLHGRGESDRLERAFVALMACTGLRGVGSREGLLEHLGARSLEDGEWRRWLGEGPRPGLPEFDERAASRLRGASWRVVKVRSVIVGPEAFNRGLEGAGSKAVVHFGAFAKLLGGIWDGAGDGVPTDVRGDKHGGRNFYLEPLSGAFPGVWIERGEEGPSGSGYTMSEGARRLTLELRPRADADDGLVAMASIVSKYLRDLWMRDFNRYWCDRVAGLKPTAGYPVDARRWREAVEPVAEGLGLPSRLWWRER